MNPIFSKSVLSSDGQAPDNSNEPHFFLKVYCHLMDKHQATVMNPIFSKSVLSSDGQAPSDSDEPHLFRGRLYLTDEYQKMVIDPILPESSYLTL